MFSRLLTRRTLAAGQEIREPRPLAIVLTAAGLLALLGVCALAIFSLHPLGYDGIVALAVAAVLALLLCWRRRSTAIPSTCCRAWFRRVRGAGRGLFVALLACWLGLIAWARVSPGGPPPAPKADPAAIRLVTWNVHCGQESGPFWKRFDWAGRKDGLRTGVHQAAPDILCVQEAVAEQVAFLEQALPTHQRIGVGRDDGKDGGEHCAIYLRRDRFELLDSGTFWLEEPINRPRGAALLDIKRICTWVRVRDLQSGRTVRVYNTHLYLTEAARLKATQIILAQIASGDPTDAVLLAGDLNATPASPTWRLITASGLADSAVAAGKAEGARTYHFFGVPLRCIDGVFVSPSWEVRGQRLLDVKPGHTFPSDHFGIVVDLILRH